MNTQMLIDLTIKHDEDHTAKKYTITIRAEYLSYKGLTIHAMTYFQGKNENNEIHDKIVAVSAESIESALDLLSKQLYLLQKEYHVAVEPAFTF